MKDVVIKYNGGQDDVALDINAGIYNLLALKAGVNVLLYEDEVPAGAISQIRLDLGDQNTKVVDGATLPLATPSAQQSGLRIDDHETLEPSILYEFMLDFDVDKSIVTQGNGGYSFKLVNRATTVAESGAISGKDLPVGMLTMVTAIDGSIDISSYKNLQGEFLLSGVPGGVYTVTLQANLGLGIPPLVIQNVAVPRGETTNLGELTF